MESYPARESEAINRVALDTQRWLHEVWEKSLEREAYEIDGLPGKHRHSLPATWHYWASVTTLQNHSDEAAARLEAAMHDFVSTLAKETGTHFVATWVVAATKEGKLHAHVLLGADPGAHGRQGLIEIMRPRRRLSEPQEPRPIPVHRRPVPKAERAIVGYLGELIVGAIRKNRVREMDRGLQVDRYIDNGWVTGGIEHRDAPHGLEVINTALHGSLTYMARQPAYQGFEPRPGFAVACPGRYARLRTCRRRSCALGLREQR